LLEEFDLTDAANRIAKTYSGGMRRRLDLALSLVATPPILFLDEPTTGLDPRSRIAIWDRIERLIKEGTTILLTTQYLEEADQLANKIVVIDHGKVIAEGTSDELKSKVGNDRLEFVFRSNADVEKAVASLGSETVRRNEQTVMIGIDGSFSHVRNIIDRIESSGAAIETFSLHKPTLDDVFLQLTGHEATEKEEEKKK
ncbi:MAG TPA: DUF4162 domain-containing protein, partial [Candidatus Kapabacteria bacterium]|nr:DUF4162 domain-containing protein [Candidatus Kapabacteria bacterium]